MIRSRASRFLSGREDRPVERTRDVDEANWPKFEWRYARTCRAVSGDRVRTTGDDDWNANFTEQIASGLARRATSVPAAYKVVYGSRVSFRNIIPVKF